MRCQVRLQHESSCSFMVVRCQWGDPDCGAELALQDLHLHLLEVHGHQVVQLEQEEEGGISLMEEMMTDCWPDNSGYCCPTVVMISALGHTFLLFMRTKDKMRDDYRDLTTPEEKACLAVAIRRLAH